VLNFQRMDVYRCAIEFLAFSTQLPESLPKGHAALADQLRRAALSVPLNIAEAAGRATDADTARHYAIARGSAMECAAVIDAFRVLDILDERQYRTAIDLLERIASMLTRLCRRE
jgi:four helix bundle protein